MACRVKQSLSAPIMTAREHPPKRPRYTIPVARVCFDLCFSYRAVKFPAPVRAGCRVPMLTVTTILQPNAVKVISYQCQKCGWTLGASHQRGERSHVVLPFSGRIHADETRDCYTARGVAQGTQANAAIRSCRSGGWTMMFSLLRTRALSGPQSRAHEENARSGASRRTAIVSMAIRACLKSKLSGSWFLK